MHPASNLALLLAALAAADHASAQLTVYERDAFQGRSFATASEVPNLERAGFSQRAASVVVAGRREDRWEVCDERAFRGRCVVLRPGEYPSLAALGLNDRVASVRIVERNARVADDRYAPTPQAAGRGGQIVFYADADFRGRSHTADSAVTDFRGVGYNDRASSIRVQGGRWEVCDGAGYSGQCAVLSRGEYPSLTAMGLNDRISSARQLGRPGRADEGRDDPTPPAAMAPGGQVDLYESEGFQGRSFSANTEVDDFRRSGFNDRASSAVVTGGRWEVCDDARYGGRCVVLRPGQYPSLSAMGLNDRVSSVRPATAGGRADGSRDAPLPLVARDYRRRSDERLYEADVTSVRAVVEDAGRQCWVEPEQAVSGRGPANVPGALLGAVIGGILGHQVGGGPGRDLATGIGAVAGAAIGANTGRGEATQQVVPTQDVRRCSRDAGPARPAYWDVTYNFHGQDHKLQMNQPPGRTITVNEQGEPRV